MPLKKQKDSKLQGVNQLLVDATLELTDVVEKLHRQIIHPPFLPSTTVQRRLTDLTTLIYKNIRWSTKFIGKGTDAALGTLTEVLGTVKPTKEREALRAVLNGLIGEHLATTENPLQVPMRFKTDGKKIALEKNSIKKTLANTNGKLLLMIHGSCMSDAQWTQNGHNHGTALATQLDKTPLFLHYNSGRHVSSNGQELSALLDKLCTEWPVPVKEITIIGHSMGGLVTRSALHYGQTREAKWTTKIKNVVFLGTPHHGASLEKAGNFVEVILKAIPYAKPFAHLAKIRGAGVTDLRYGNLLDEDWWNIDQHKLNGDNRTIVPLPENISFYNIAATTAKPKKSGATRMMNDKLVTVKSATGKHSTKKKTLSFEADKTTIVYNTNHTGLLSSPEVYEQLLAWMTK